MTKIFLTGLGSLLTLVILVGGLYVYPHKTFATKEALSATAKEVKIESLRRQHDNIRQTIWSYQKEFGADPEKNPRISDKDVIEYRELLEERKSLKKRIEKLEDK